MALIKCNECGKQVSDKATSCPNCGNPINNTNSKTDRVCEHCGGYVYDNAVTCVHCGKELKENIRVKREKTNVCASIGFVFGFLSMIINPFALFGVTAIILCCIGSVQIKNNGEKGNGYAIFGFILGLISIIYFIYQIIEYEQMIVSIFS